jgi:hypothetical protein
MGGAPPSSLHAGSFPQAFCLADLEYRMLVLVEYCTGLILRLHRITGDRNSLHRLGKKNNITVSNALLSELHKRGMVRSLYTRNREAYTLGVCR